MCTYKFDGERLKLEAYSSINENAHIQGVALIPTISRNNNLYTKAELERFDGVTVPLNWEHNPDKVIGQVTFRYDSSQETVYYEGDITDASAAMVAKNKTLFTSIEAEPEGVEEICNHGSAGDCFAMPFGLKPQGLALTETPGVTQTTVHVMESYINRVFECSHHDPHEQGRDYTKMEKSIKQILQHLDLEECDCGELKKKSKLV